MVMKSVDEIALQEQMWYDTVEKEIIKRFIWKRSDLLAVGTKLIPTENFRDIDIVWELPEGEATITYPTPIEAKTGRMEVITWFKFGFSLYMGEFRWMISDNAKIRGQEPRQRRAMIRKGGEAFAKIMDKNIIDELIAKAGQSVTIASGDEWDAATPGDPINDIATAWGNILHNSNVQLAEMKNLKLVVPTIVWKDLLQKEKLNEIVKSKMDHIRDNYGITILPSRYLGSTAALDMALLVVNSPDTGVFGNLRTNVVPMTEKNRIGGRGDEYITRRFFATKVMPESSSDENNNRICKITNVTTTV